MVFGLDDFVGSRPWMTRMNCQRLPEVYDYVFIPESDDLGKGRLIIVESFGVLALGILETDHRRPSQCDYCAIRKHCFCETSCHRFRLLG